MARLWTRLAPGQQLELSGERGTGRSTLAAQLARCAQHAGEPAVWLERGPEGVYPPDLHAAGVDLAALTFVRMPQDSRQHDMVRAAEILLRSGAFGLVIMDLSGAAPVHASRWLTRLGGLARLHGTRLIWLTSSDVTQASLGPLIHLRVHPRLCLDSSGRRWIEPCVLRDRGAPAVTPGGTVRADAPSSVSTPPSRAVLGRQRGEADLRVGERLEGSGSGVYRLPAAPCQAPSGAFDAAPITDADGAPGGRYTADGDARQRVESQQDLFAGRSRPAEEGLQDAG